MRKLTKILGIITIMVLLLGGVIGSAVAAPEAVPVSINAPDEVEEDSPFTATVDIGEVVDLNAAQYHVSFDNTLLRLDDITSGLIDTTGVSVLAFNEISPGTWSVVQYVEPVSGSGYLAVLHFHAIGSSCQSSAIDLPSGMLSGWEGEIEATWTGDSVHIMDTTPPTVVSTSPEADETDVTLDAVVSATFDEDIQEGDNFGGIAISGATGVSASIVGAILTIAHDDFAYETTYEVTIPAGAVDDLIGNPLAEAKVWSFTTAEVKVTYYTLTMAVEGEGTVTPESGTYPEGDMTITATSASGWRFAGWSTDDMTEIAEPSEASTTLTLDKDKTVTATFTERVGFTSTLSADWNLLSTPIKLDADSDTLEQIFDAESQSNIWICYRWDAVSDDWEQVFADYELLPLYAIYVKVKADATVVAEFFPFEELSWPPSRELEEGLNLIGPAPALEGGVFPAMPLDQALISIEEADGLRGYMIVISPEHNQPGWTYALGGEIKDLLSYKGYWVVMERADTLYGFSTTPIP